MYISAYVDDIDDGIIGVSPTSLLQPGHHAFHD